jgi:choline dehydrogenase-like flavoprotein
MAKKCKIGDVIEIPTRVGLAYAQFSHLHPRYNALLRVLPGKFDSRPSDLSTLVAGKERFVTFFPLQAAVNQGILCVAGNYPIPSAASSFPLFRTGIEDPQTRKVKVWWLWDGEKEWKVGDITQEQRKLPLRGIWNDTLLIERIEADWTPETDPA